VLAGGEVEQVQAPVVEQQQVQQPVQATDGGAEAGRKKRRSRWEPETEAKPAVLQGLQIALPPSIAALVDVHVDLKVTELQRQLNIVSTCSTGNCSLCNSIRSFAWHFETLISGVHGSMQPQAFSSCVKTCQHSCYCCQHTVAQIPAAHSPDH
jgi:hypothetical protein